MTKKHSNYNYTHVIAGLRLALAKEDELEEESVDVDNEGVAPEVVSGTEDTESPDVKDTGSVNADLFLLFTKPTFPSLSNIGVFSK